MVLMMMLYFIVHSLAPPSNGSTNNNNFVSPNQPIDRNQYPILRQHLKQEEPSDMQAYTMTTSQFRVGFWLPEEPNFGQS